VVSAGGKAEGQWPEGKFSSSSVAGGADPGRGAERLTERLLSRQTLGNGSRGAAELAEKIQFSSSALSAPPREKKCGWQTRTLGNGEETKCLKKGNITVHAEPRRRGENPIFLPPRSPRLRVRKNPAGKRELSRGSDSNEHVLNPVSGTKFHKSIDYQPQRTQKNTKNTFLRNLFIKASLCSL
jgi:hypothetical protein